jgi:hypothetical protein
MSGTQSQSNSSLAQMRRAFTFAGLLWLIPFLVSIFFYNQDGDLLVDFWVFKVAMVVVASVTSIFLFRWYYKGKDIHPIKILIPEVLLVNVVLDLIVLVGLLGMELSFWAISILPVYIVMIPLTIIISARYFGPKG